jgi:hypothetical protein
MHGRKYAIQPNCGIVDEPVQVAVLLRQAFDEAADLLSVEKVKSCKTKFPRKLCPQSSKFWSLDATCSQNLEPVAKQAVHDRKT